MATVSKGGPGFSAIAGVAFGAAMGLHGAGFEGKGRWTGGIDSNGALQEEEDKLKAGLRCLGMRSSSWCSSRGTAGPLGHRG